MQNDARNRERLFGLVTFIGSMAVILGLFAYVTLILVTSVTGGIWKTVAALIAMAVLLTAAVLGYLAFVQDRKENATGQQD